MGLEEIPQATRPPVERGTDPDLSMKQVSLYLDIYQQHLDLLVKGTALYLATVGTVAGFVVKEGTSGRLQVTLTLFVALLSVVGIFLCRALDGWVSELERVVTGILRSLQAEPFPFSAAHKVIRFTAILCTLVAVAAVVFAISRYADLRSVTNGYRSVTLLR